MDECEWMHECGYMYVGVSMVGQSENEHPHLA